MVTTRTRFASDDALSLSSSADAPWSPSSTTKTVSKPSSACASRASFQLLAPGTPTAGKSLNQSVWASLSPSTMTT